MHFPTFCMQVKKKHTVALLHKSVQKIYCIYDNFKTVVDETIYVVVVENNNLKHHNLNS